MISMADLPTWNATLNATSALLLGLGYFFVRKRKITQHKICMMGAFTTSSLFLISYLIYHYYTGSRPFTGQGWVRYSYFAILISHSLLAAVIVPMALLTLWRALRGRFDQHRRIARWTLPIWIYVSITGVVVYLMLYQLYAS